MEKTSRKKYTPEFKAQVAIDALKEQATLAELAKKYDVSPTMISHWKRIWLMVFYLLKCHLRMCIGGDETSFFVFFIEKGLNCH